MSKNQLSEKTLLQKVDYTFLQAAPVMITFILCCIMILPFGLPVSSAITPNLFLISVFYWALYRAKLLPLVAVFIIGLFLDVFNGDYFGLNALWGVVTYGVIYQQRHFLMPLSFSVIWAIFAATLVVMTGLGILAHFAYGGTQVDELSIFIKTVLTLCLYPIFSVWFARVDAQRAEAEK